MTIGPHLDSDDLERLAAGRAAAGEIERFEEHLLLCEPCRERFGETGEYVQAMQAAAAQWRADQFPARWWSLPRLIPALAALAVLAIAILAVARFNAVVPLPLAVSLTAIRGTVPAGTARAGRVLALSPDLAGIAAPGPYRLLIVNTRGAVAWQGPWDPAAGPARVPARSAGTYFVRLYASSGVLLREYGLDVQR